MKPPLFSYHDPRSTADVVGLLTSLDNAKLLAGGQSLMPMLNMRFVQPDHVIDLNRVDGLSYIREQNGALEIGAMTRQRDIEFSDLVRTVAVLGKNGARSIAFSDFPAGYMMSSIELDELVTGATFPCWAPGHGYAFVEFSRRHGDFAIVSAAALVEEDGNGKVTRASVTLGGMGPAPVRAHDVERALIGEMIEEKRLREICETLRQIDAIEDIHAPASYRQQLATVLPRRALLKAHERIAKGTGA
jgi:aerobic carbon-monoxide dehydrogenase medium subunit